MQQAENDGHRQWHSQRHAIQHADEGYGRRLHTECRSIKRFADSVLLFRDDVAFDEVAFPTGKVTYTDNKLSAAKSLVKSGQRSLLVYVTPAGRSPLEVLRNYQGSLKAAGFTPLYECEGDACGAADSFTGSNNFNFGNTLFKDRVYSTARSDAHVCAAGAQITGFRYTLLDNPATGETAAVMTWRPLIKGYALPCPDDMEARTSVAVFRVQAKAMEEKMVTVSASEMTNQLTANGKVAIYGILFDSAKADIKPESKASLDEIGKLMKATPALKLHVVGHTDNAGGLEGNFDLSKRRAGAVKDALVKQYGAISVKPWLLGAKALCHDHLMLKCIVGRLHAAAPMFFGLAG